MSEGPQTENGYVRIANELFDAILRFGFSKRELSIVLAVIRKTYGYQKKSDELSASQIEQMTGIPRNHVAECLVTLNAKNVVLKRDGKYANSLSFNKHYGQWGSPKTGLVPKRDGGSPKTGLKLVPKRDTQKTTQKTIPKDNDLTFDPWYSGYPKKVAKVKAEQAWNKLTKTEKEKAMTALKTWPFQADNQYNPNPATWLNQKRWDDSVTKPNGGLQEYPELGL